MATTSTTSPDPSTPAGLETRLGEVQRHLPQTLDLVPTSAASGPDMTAVRVRLMTADPLEGLRGGADRFVATHTRGGEMNEVIAYLSFGQAERDAERTGWDTYLAQVVATVRRAVEAAAGTPVGSAHGADPLEDLADLAEATDGESFEVGEWQPFSIGVMVDLTEAKEGPLGFPDEPLTPSRLGSPTAGCVACEGQQLRPPHTPVATIMGLCHEHQREHDGWMVERLPQEGDDAAAMHDLLVAMGRPRVSGIGTARAAIQREEERAADLLHRARSWFDEPGGLSAAYLTEDRYEEDSVAALLHLGTEQVNLEEGTTAALEALDTLRFLVPEACWLADVDAMSWLDAEDEAVKDLMRHLEADHDDIPSAICAVAEQHEIRGDTATAIPLFRRGYVRALAAGEPPIAELAEAGLARLGEEAPHPQSKVGRNDPCPCGSGKKFKKCCGR